MICNLDDKNLELVQRIALTFPALAGSLVRVTLHDTAGLHVRSTLQTLQHQCQATASCSPLSAFDHHITSSNYIYFKQAEY